MEPFYSLEQVRELVIAGLFITTRRAGHEAENEFDFRSKEIGQVLLELTESDFDRTICSNQTGRYNDVYIKKIYSPAYNRVVSTYIKLEILERLIVISFHTQNHF